MRYVLITSDGPEHRFVANSIDRAIGLSAIVIDAGPPRNLRSRIKQLWRRYTLIQLLGRAVLAALKILWRDKRKYNEELRRVLGDDTLEFLHPEIVTRVQGINSTRGIDTLRGLEPDRLLIYGTGMIKDQVLELSRKPPLNMHTGISPFYRGDSCAFWPLYNNELNRLGATIHVITSRVDGGDIYSTGEAKLHPDDSLHGVFARCVQIGAELYVEVLGMMERGEPRSTPQNLDLGREYRASMRGLGAELRVRRSVGRGLIRQWCAAARNVAAS